MCFDLYGGTFLTLRRTEFDIRSVYWSSCEVRVILVMF